MRLGGGISRGTRFQMRSESFSDYFRWHFFRFRVGNFNVFFFFFFFPRSKRVHFFVQLDVSKSVSYGSAPGEKNQRMA